VFSQPQIEKKRSISKRPPRLFKDGFSEIRLSKNRLVRAFVSPRARRRNFEESMKMKRLESKIISLITVFLLTTAAAFGANQFEGYSLIVAADDSGVCPVQYRPGGSNYVDVFVAGTTTAATGLTACGGSTVSGNRVTPNGDGRWCFTGANDNYDIQLDTGLKYLWLPTTKTSGFYNVKDFRPFVGGAQPEPADYTKTIKNAVAFIATRNGGTLYFPEGKYIVGTTDGNTRDTGYTPITLPSGIVIIGSSPQYSIPTTNVPAKQSSSTIRLRNNNQTIFRIGGCTDQIIVRNLELLGNSALYGEQARDATGDIGIEGLGKWAINPTTQAETPNSSQVFKFENVTFQNLDKGIWVHNANDGNCNASTQQCHSWQFDYVKVDHGTFINNKTGIWINTYNTDWKITNSAFAYSAQNAPGNGIRLEKAGAVLIEQSFGGGYDYGSNIGGTFVYVDTTGALSIINSASERGQRSIYFNPAGAISNVMLTVINSIFGDKIELGGRLNYISTGNFYGAATVVAGSDVKITSTGDRFCYDPLVLPGFCKDSNGQTVSNPGFNGGKIMFQTGRVAEGSGNDVIQRRPNYFGHEVEVGDDDYNNNDALIYSHSYNYNKPLLRLGQPGYYYDFKRREYNGFLTITGNQDKPYRGITINGPLQFDKDMTYNDIVTYGNSWLSGYPVITDGVLVYCKDCAKNTTTGLCQQGTAGTDGAFAKRINGTWRCD
jgi:hypothetical protein